MSSLPRPVLLPSFDGPLDFFLEEVRGQGVPIAELRLAPIVGRYLDYVRGEAGRNLGLRMEWIEMAATLIRWQSRQLLEPALSSEKEGSDDLRSDLIHQLQNHAKEVAGQLALRRDREALSWTHPSFAEWQAGPAPEEEEEEQRYFSAWDVIAQTDELRHWVLAHRLEQQERERLAYSVSGEDCTVEEMSQWLREQLVGAEPNQWVAAEALFAKAGCLPRQCSLFLAVLDLARDSLGLQQTGEFSFALGWRANGTSADVRPLPCL